MFFGGRGAWGVRSGRSRNAALEGDGTDVMAKCEKIPTRIVCRDAAPGVALSHRRESGCGDAMRTRMRNEYDGDGEDDGCGTGDGA